MLILLQKPERNGLLQELWIIKGINKRYKMTLQTFIENTQEKYPQVDKDTIKLLVIEVMEYLQEK
jgi:hypothetical protein